MRKAAREAGFSRIRELRSYARYGGASSWGSARGFGPSVRPSIGAGRDGTGGKRTERRGGTNEKRLPERENEEKVMG